MSKDLRVLIADDMPAVRMILRDMLEKIGLATVDEAEDGEIAWEMLKSSYLNPAERGFTLVIADWDMPGMTGGELLRAARGFGPTKVIPFLLCTSLAGQKYLDQAVSYGASDYIVKPFNISILEQKIKYLLNL